MKNIRKTAVKTALLLFIGFFFVSCFPEKKNKEGNIKEKIALFVPGILSESPPYKMFVEGAKRYVKENAAASGVELKVIEAGVNQGEWLHKLLALAAEGKYSLIITSNPSMPDLIHTVSEQFASQKFIALDAQSEGLENLYTIGYDQREAAFLAGYVAALSSKTNRIALFAGQEYPAMTNVIFPAFREGAKLAAEACSAHFAVTGSWSDVSKGEALASSFILKGVDVILPITGGAANGVIHASEKASTRLVWFDEDGKARSPDFVVASIIIRHDKMAEAALDKFFTSAVPWGESSKMGVKDGFIELSVNEKIYSSVLDEKERTKVDETFRSLKEGNFFAEEK